MEHILITGGGSGIGKALALAFAKPGKVLLLAGRNEAALKEVCDACISKGARAKYYIMDLQVPEGAARLVTQIKQDGFSVQVLINNAGISQRGSAAETLESVDRYVMELNYFAPVRLTKLLLPDLRACGGHLVVISSLSGLFGFPLRSAYAASKHALHGFFETLQLEEPQIKTTLVCPGRIKTDISLHALTSDGQPHGKMDPGQQKGIPASDCALKIVKAMRSGKRKVIIAREEKILLFLHEYIPSLFYKIASKIKAI